MYVLICGEKTGYSINCVGLDGYPFQKTDVSYTKHKHESPNEPTI